MCTGFVVAGPWAALNHIDLSYACIVVNGRANHMAIAVAMQIVVLNYYGTERLRQACIGSGRAMQTRVGWAMMYARGLVCLRAYFCVFWAYFCGCLRALHDLCTHYFCTGCSVAQNWMGDPSLI